MPEQRTYIAIDLKSFLSGAKVQRYKEFSAEAEGGGEG